MISEIFLILALLFSSGSSVKDSLDKYLKANLSRYKDYKYEILRMPGEKSSKLEILKDKEMSISGNLAYVPVQMTDKEKRVSRAFITVRLKLYENVLVAVKPLDRKQNFAATDFEFKKIDVTQLNGTPFTSEKEIKSLRSKIFIKSGDVLIKEMVEPVPLVNAGDPVKAFYINGSVAISLDAVSRQDGLKGEVIRIMSQDGKQFKARIADAHDVLIIE